MEFSCLDALLLKAEIFIVDSRVSDLLNINFAVPVYVISFCYEFCIYPYDPSLEIKKNPTQLIYEVK